MKRAALVLVVAVLAGCAGTPGSDPGGPSSRVVPHPSPTAMPLSQGFDASTALPAGWSADAGSWTVAANASAKSAPNVLRGVGGGGRSTLRAPGSYKDFVATVQFQMVTGDEGAGLSFRSAPDGDYRIVRYSVREDGWHYFIMEGGTADKRNEASVAQNVSKPQYGEWVALRIRAEGAHVQAWHGETLVIDFMEPDAPQAGAIGPFLRGSAEALFDDLLVEPV